MTRLLGIFLFCMLLSACTASPRVSQHGGAVLEFSDGRAPERSLDAINQTLGSVGVRLETVRLPDSARQLRDASAHAPLSDAEKTRLLDLFSLSRQDVVRLAQAAGRTPVISDGGSLTTAEVGVPPYPKVYDLRSMDPQDRLAARNKFARLHVNSTDDGVGVDEVMTLVSGGPWTWFFLLENDVVARLSMSRVEPSGPGWRLIYPGLTPHGGHFHAEDGLCVAYITGPETWSMRYESPGIPGSKMLGKNPWIDFTAP